MDADVIAANDELSKISKIKRIKKTKKVRATMRAALTSRFLKLEQVLEIVPISRSALYLMSANGEFPKQIKLGNRSMAWSKSEVMEWVNEKLSR